MRHRTLIVSDLHLGPAAPHAGGAAWYRPDLGLERLVDMLEREVIARADTVRALVFLGDTFDAWASPMDAPPPRYEVMIEDNAPLFDALARCAERGVSLIFTRGNHDYDLTREALAGALPTARVCDEVELAPGVWAEHGHARTMFNSSLLDPREGRPLGYFFSRLGPERLPGGDSPRAIISYIRSGVLGRLHRPDFLARLLEVVFQLAGVDDRAGFVMEGGVVTSVAEVKARYAMACEEMSVRERLWRLMEVPRALGGSAHQVRRERRARAVIFGHTHGAGMRAMAPDTIYANTGAWCEERCHFVELEEVGGEVALSLMEASDARVHVRQRHVFELEHTVAALAFA